MCQYATKNTYSKSLILWFKHDIKTIGRSVAGTASAALVSVIKMPVGIFCMDIRSLFHFHII